MVRIFVSTESSADEWVAEVIARLKREPSVQLDQSPLNPSIGDDPRWEDWYRRGSNEAIANVDNFIAAVSKGYDSSTWMAHEFDVAWKQHRAHGSPRLFLAKRTSKPLPLGFKPYEEASIILVGVPDTIVPALLERVRATATNRS